MPSRGLAEVALGRRNLQPLLASAAQPATASPLSENLRRYEKYGLGARAAPVIETRREPAPPLPSNPPRPAQPPVVAVPNDCGWWRLCNAYWGS